MATRELIASAPDNTQRLKRERQFAFLMAFRSLGNITQSMAPTGVHRQQHYEWMDDPLYAAEFTHAREAFVEHMEAEALRRATQGNRRYKFTKDGSPIRHPELCVCGATLAQHTDTSTPGDGGPPLRGCEATGCGDFVGQPYFEHEQSDTLLIFLLKANDPEKYRERVDMRGQVEHTGGVQLYIPDNGRT